MTDLIASTFWSWGALSYLLGLFGIAGIILWWIVRKKRERIWLPTLRILQQSKRQLPSLRLRFPPWIPFFCFMTLFTVLLILSGEPHKKIFKQRSQKYNREHMFIDLSPSVSAYITSKEYKETIARAYEKFTSSGQTKISISFSDKEDIYHVASVAELIELIKGVDFHRFGTRIGRSVETQFKNLGQVDKLYIFSDGDAFSWEGFNWQYLQEKTELQFVDLKSSSKVPGNVFISYARLSPSLDTKIYEWNVEISRRGTGGEDRGKLSLVMGSQSLGEIAWHIGSGQLRTDLNVSIPQSDITEALTKSGTDPLPDLFWRITSVNQDNDRIYIDNDFRISPKLSRPSMLVIAEPSGERFIEDPTYHFQLALESQGVAVRRVDKLNADSLLNEYPFVVVFGGGVVNDTEYCPLSLLKKRSALRKQVWLVPIDLNADYVSLCKCLSQLTEQYSANNLGHCQHIKDLENWAEFPRSIGAKLVGGGVSDKFGFAWNQVNNEKNLEIISFNIPLQPSRRTGLWYVKLPLLLKQILKWQGESEAVVDIWPRLDHNVGLSEKHKSNFQLSNVPLGESVGKLMDDDLLPGQVSISDFKEISESTGTFDTYDDSRSWVTALAYLTLFIFLLELIDMFYKRVAAFMRIRVEIIFLTIFFGGLIFSYDALATIDIATHATNHQNQFERLAKDVEHRTSLDLGVKDKRFSKINFKTFAEPWLWVSSVSDLTGPSTKSDMSLWLKKGGFLIVQGKYSDAQLTQLTSLFKSEGSWQTIPADHEVMRSFYLIKSLHACDGFNWRGFHADGRLVILNIPYDLLASVQDVEGESKCKGATISYEDSVRSFVNILMVALATDYKKDQIHLPEILKRLR